MTVLLSHPTGNPNVRAVLRALEKSDLLHTFHTCLALPEPFAQAAMLPSMLRTELNRRVFSEVARSKIRTHQTREILRIAGNRLNLQSLIRHESGFASVDRVYQDLDRAVARNIARPGLGVRAVYAYEDGALHSFRAARAKGIITIYDLPIPYWRTVHRILGEEKELRPEWASTLAAMRDSAAKLDRKDEEIGLADHILVASAFTKRSLTEHFGDRLRTDVTPYGAPTPQIRSPSTRSRSSPLRVLYAGHLRQSKGIAYLFDALHKADFPWHLTLAGPAPADKCCALDQALDDPRCHWLGAIPHATLLKEMTRAHVFVFPSLLEGFGLVILEAMAAALPVIATPHTAGPECIDEGVDGHIVPIRDASAITTRLAALYDDEDRRLAMASAALVKARQRSWLRYESRISALVADTLA